ncbi:MAG: class I SAM-dependent methyltransferase [Chitinophagaceae bacterium]|nr:class I SAM-dependent methyltransferase [Chitinophagaceae bacterium]MBK9571007.1 class I SAM-dependent methyltransferase [Chitinophagaceae bacterium]MBL0273371.1 class I SAM-dependent methyltransferase [Chitinophagaceae bacterium]
MFEFHADRKKYFDIQVLNAEKYVIPFIEEKFPVKKGMRVLEIGCGEGGVLKAFINKGCAGVGVELDASRIDNARLFLPEDMAAGRLRFVVKDIYLVDVEKDFNGLFDIIVLKDVIEHIHDQAKLIGWMKKFLKPGGIVFFGFPPWYMPFGGHQQMCHSTISKLPYIHLLPKNLYRWILKKKKEPVEALMEIRDTGISIERFERICKKEGYTFFQVRHYLLNPIYEWKFGWKPVKQFSLIKAIPFVRNFYTTCVYYIIQPITNINSV